MNSIVTIRNNVNTALWDTKNDASEGLSVCPSPPFLTGSGIGAEEIAATLERNLLSFDKKPGYSHFWTEVKARQNRIHSDKNIAKVLLKERISGKSIADGGEAAPYLEYNAQDRGDLEAIDIVDFKYQENIISQCGKSVVWFEGDKTALNYVKKISCRKSWCPDCGGKGGKIHKSRLSSILTRVDVEKYNLQQLVLTIPENLRHFFTKRENLEYLEQSAKKLTEKFFGVPIFDKKGHVKKYKLDVGVISNIHLFGEEKGIFKPHVNIQILQNKDYKLKIEKSKLESIKKYWLKKLKIFDELLDVVNVHFSYRDMPAKVMHALKYMCRPWSAEDYAAIEDEDLKKLLVLDLSGFRYLRFWGSLSDRSYKDEMDISDIKKECESKIDEKLIMLFVAPFDFGSWSSRLEEIDEGFYRIKRKKVKEKSILLN